MQLTIRNNKGQFAKGTCGFVGKHSEETKKQLSLANQKRVTTEKQLEALAQGRANRKGMKASEETRQKISLNRRGKNIGENHHLWKGGHSKGYREKYYSSEFKDWRKAVFARDNYTCQDCGITGNRVRLNAHHIKSWAQYAEYRFDMNNGKTLCEPCHAKTDNFRGRNMLNNNLIKRKVVI